MMSKGGVYSDQPRPRLCHLRRWPDFAGYGFNLHSEKSKPGQYIGKVDRDSPAEAAGLNENDRIVEVNSVPIGNENHRQVVARIKEGVTRNGTKYPDEVMLLVLDPIADTHYKKKSIVVKSSDPNVEKRQSGNRNGAGSRNNSPHSSDRSSGRADSPLGRETPPSPKRNEPEFTRPTVTNTKNSNSPAISRNSDRNYARPNDRDSDYESPPPASNNDKYSKTNSANSYTNINPPATDFYARPVGNNPSQPSPANGAGGVFEIRMSAAEYREKLKAQNAHKRDPRKSTQMSMKEKHDFIDRL